jgi:hypothetical protein
MSIELKKVLNKEFKARGLVANKVAKQLKIPQSVLHGWCTGSLPNGKNLHHIQALSAFLGLTVSELLFGNEDKSGATTLFNSEFRDGEMKYRLYVEKIKKD